MKKSTLNGTLLLLGALAAGFVCSCTEEVNPFGDTQTGSIVPTVDLDSRVTASTPKAAPASRASSEAMAVSLDDITLTLKPGTGVITTNEPYSWTGVSNFPLDRDFPVGKYTLEVSYGDTADEGFEKPAYFGSSELEVEENKTSSVSVEAELINSMVSVTYTDAFTSYVTDYSAALRSSAPEGSAIPFSASETRPAYIQPGLTELSVTMTKPNGVSGTISAASFTAKARTHHHVTVDLNGGAGGGNVFMVITFDDTLTDEPVEIELSDELFNSPAPVVTVQGFTSGQAMEFVPGLYDNSSAITANITAQAEIASAMLTTSGPALIAAGWPAEIDLTQASAAQQELLESLGLKVLGLFRNPGRMAVVDFSDLPLHIQYLENGSNETRLSLVVTDKAGKSAEPVELVLEAQPIVLEIEPLTEVLPGESSEPIELKLEFSGDDPQNQLTFQYHNNRGTWSDLNVLSITPAARSTQSYIVKVSMPEGVTDMLEIRVVCNASESVASSSVTIRKSPFDISAVDNEVYGRRAAVVLTSDELDAAALAATATLSVKKDNSPVSVTGLSRDGAQFSFAGLEPGTTYRAVIEIPGQPTRSCSFTTEAAIQLKDSEFDSWNSTRLEEDCYQYLWTVGDGNTWSTLNAITTREHGNGCTTGISCKGAAYKADSGTIPANGRSTKSGDGGGTFGTNKSGDGSTTGNATLHSDKQHNGANAALIRTIGWGSSNAAGSFNGRFGTVNNITPGELFLGSCSTDAASYGMPFASRPEALKFFYHYDPVTSNNGDFGQAIVEVFDAAGTRIGNGSLDLTEQSAWTEKTLHITYVPGAPKAAKLSIVFRSSANNDALQGNTTYMTAPGAKNISGGEFIGSELYIDDVTLVY